MIGPVLLLLLGALLGFGSFVAGAGNMKNTVGRAFNAPDPRNSKAFHDHLQSMQAGWGRHFGAMVGMGLGALLAMSGGIWLIVMLVRG